MRRIFFILHADSTPLSCHPKFQRLSCCGLCTSRLLVRSKLQLLLHNQD